MVAWGFGPGAGVCVCGADSLVDRPALPTADLSMSFLNLGHDHVLKVADLVDRPGASRRVELAMAVPDDLDLPLVAVHPPLRLDGVVESVVEGVLVRGSLTGDVTLECARCLEPVAGVVRADVVELFQDPRQSGAEPDEAEPGYDIRDGHIDLEALVRDALAPEAPTQPLCRLDCAGLCATCGANLNDTACSCGEEDVDPRWAVLEGLDLPPEA